MKTIKREIERCITDLTALDRMLTAHFVFPEDFIGFQGHFPGNKILPGICQIQCIIIMLERWKKKRVMLKEIVLAKFLSSVFPSEELTCVCKDIADTSGDFILKASCSKGSQKISELKLRVCFEHE